MPNYVTVQLSPKDSEVLAEYRKVGGKAVAKHNGSHIAGGATNTVIEENGMTPRATILLSFPTAEAAKSWINDPELAAIHAQRRAGADTIITLLADVS